MIYMTLYTMAAMDNFVSIIITVSTKNLLILGSLTNHRWVIYLILND